MIKNPLRRFILIGVTCTFVLLLVSSGISNAQEIEEDKPEKNYVDFKLKISPFFWILGIKGEIIAPPRPVQFPIPPPPKYEIDIGFDDVITNLKFFLMLSNEFKTKNFVFAASVTSLVLDGEAITPFQLITEGISYRFSYLTSEITAGYRLVKKENLNLNTSLGARILNTKIEASSEIKDITFEGERSVFWWDPIVAIQLIYRPWPRIELEGYSDFGPIRNINSYQLYAEGTYHFTPTFHMATGFRNYYVNTESEVRETIYQGRIYGPYLRFGFQF